MRTTAEETKLLSDMRVGVQGYGLEKVSAEQLGIGLQKMSDFPAGENVFQHDLYHMGVGVFEGLTIMYGSAQKGQSPEYMILCFPKTGKRIRVTLPKELVG